ncbi:MAG: hypothetical protein EXR72_20005 [Myxococcales bacterium]|nr:hypothetical protein [Myxococcales bacterium]
MRTAAIALGCLLAAGCGSSGPPANPMAVVGTYNVMIAANGKTDSDVVNVILGSGDTVLLNFVILGFTQMRCTVSGSSGLAVPRQKLIVGMATGGAESVVAGTGSVTADGTLALELTVMTPGIGPPDAGSGGAPVTYTITGTRNN